MKWIIMTLPALLLIGCATGPELTVGNDGYYYNLSEECAVSYTIQNRAHPSYPGVVCKNSDGIWVTSESDPYTPKVFKPLHPEQVAYIKKQKAERKASIGSLNRAMVGSGVEMQKTYSTKNYDVNLR